MSKVLFGRDDCVSCSGSSPVCNCSSGEQCVLCARTCSQCPTIQCIKQASSSGGGVNPGVVAGPIVAVLVIASLGLFWWLRRKKRRDLARLEELATRARKAESAGLHLSAPSSPQPGSAHSSSQRSYHASFRASQLPAPPPSASVKRSGARSPLPLAPVNAEYYDDAGYQANTGMVDLGKDPFSDAQSFSTTGSAATTSDQSSHVIPIRYIPPGGSDDAYSKDQHGVRPVSSAARTLNEARQNLLKPRTGVPQRPARSPGLDLRLDPSGNGNHDQDMRSPQYSSNQVRDSFASGTSGSMSFMSGQSTDLHLDAPKIVTSKQVHIGRLQQAEVVHFNQNNSNSNNRPEHLQLPGGALSPGSPQTFGATPVPSGSSVRTLTPTQIQRRVDEEDSLHSAGSEVSHPTDTDLRFSMGSWNRASVSTMGTSRYLAQPQPQPQIPSPRPIMQTPQKDSGSGARESMFSTKSYADSLLGAYPMIPPSTPRHPVQSQTSLPQSTSSSTLDHATLSRPPPAFRPIGTRPNPGIGAGASRPTTADSLLNTFAFVPPNTEGLADLPSAALPTAASTPTLKGLDGQRGVSTTSEGLGGFDFSFGEAPPLPSPRAGYGQGQGNRGR